MRFGWSIAAISVLMLLIRSDQATGQQVNDDEIVSKKVALPPIHTDPTLTLRPLAELAHAFETGQLDVPPEASVEDRIRYLQELSKLSDDLSGDYRTIQASITQAQGKAAEDILEESQGVSDEDFYLAAKLGLSSRIGQIPFSTPDEQQKTYELVARQLEIGAAQGFKLDEIRNVTRTADYLERHADRGLALEACSRFATIIRSTNNPRYRDTMTRLDDTARRLELVGQPFELSGSTVAGNPIQWSQYRNKVVLVSFWATWSLPSLAEIPQLKRQYEAYGGQGFEIIGVSLDQSRDQLEEVIAKEQIPWPNLFQEGSGVDHPMALKYGVRAIPSGFLIDADGKVVSIKARGTNLDRLLDLSFGPESSAARELAFESRWVEAAKELQRLVIKHPRKIDYRVALGGVQLTGNDPLGYAGTCQASWMEIMQTSSPKPAELIPLYCLPGTHRLDRNEIYNIAKSIREQSSTNQAKLAVIMSAFRAAQYESCLKEEIIEGDAFSIAIAALNRAMAADRVGQSELAETLLTEARGIVALRLSDYYNPSLQDLPYEHWICCVIANLVLAEADASMSDNETPKNRP